MADLLRMPEVAANTTGALVAAWSVAVDSQYRAHDTIVVIETAKASVDIEAESDGVLLATLVPVGVDVPVGAPIALLGAPGEQIADIDAALAALGVEAPAPAESPGVGDRRPSRSPAAPSPVDGVAVAGGRLFVSPLARRLAREAGLDAATITGSGPDGRIVRRDVEAAIRRSDNGVSSVAESSPVESSGAAAPVIGVLPAPNGVTDVPHSRLRRAIAARLSASTQEAPHFYLRGSARVDSLMRLRAELNEVAAFRVSINDLVIKAAALAHVQVPDMNVIWTAEAIRRYSSVDIAVAVATDAGLVTPVLRDVDTASVSAIARDTADLGDRARRSALQQPELEGGTLTVTNLGMYGTEEFAAIINPPHAAILAVGAVRQEPVVIEGRIDIASVMNFTLSVDHRPVDGVTAAVWMRAFIGILERPVRLLA
ncbi:MAG: hypothetical protein QOH52_1458 [Pseudonocardiales bacterium]|nr:hypothetical protein [Pseudonocardiales bacterium]